MSAPFTPSTDTQLDSADLASIADAITAMLGAKCSVQHSIPQGGWTTYKSGVPCDVVSINAFSDPEVINYIRAINISLNAYRMVTLPAGAVVNIDDRILIEPVTQSGGKYTSPVYYVVETENADETQPAELRLHCRYVKGAPV